MIFRETTQEDLDFMADNSISRGIQKYQPEQIDYLYTLEHEDKPLGVGGFRLINCTTAWCWLNMSHLAGDNIRTVYRTIKEFIETFAQNHKLKRLQAYISCDFEEAIRMVTHLGFERESILKNFIDNKDAFMYRKLL